MTHPRRKRQPGSAPPISAGPRVALYHRVSTLDQDRTLAARELTGWAERNGATIVLDEQESASGAWNGRPKLQRILDAARRGQVDTVIVWKLDRWGRSALDVLANIQALTDAGVRFVAISQGLDVKPNGDAMSKLMLTVLAAVAEFERDLIRERTHLGLDRARRAGKTLGRPKAEGPAPAAVRSMRKQGKSWSEIAESLACTVAMARRRAGEARAT